MIERKKPTFVQEQLFFSQNPGFRIQMKKIGDQIPLEKRKTIFISHSWGSSFNDDADQEEWIHFFAIDLAKHIELLGFKVILDARDAGIGIHLNSTTKETIENIDHALLLVTKSYLQKVESFPLSGVARELMFFQEKLSSNTLKTNSRDDKFFLVFSLIDNIDTLPVDKYFPLFVSQLGYLKALLTLPTLLYGLNVEQTSKIFIKPASVLEQEEVCSNVNLQEEFKKIGEQVSLDKKRQYLLVVLGHLRQMKIFFMSSGLMLLYRI